MWKAIELIALAPILMFALVSVAAERANKTETADPQHFNIEIKSGRPQRPQRPIPKKNVTQSADAVSSATPEVAGQPWSGTKDVRILQIDRRCRMTLVGNTRIQLAEIAIPEPSRLNGQEGEIGIVTRDYVSGLLKNAVVTIDLPTGTVPSQNIWPVYINTPAGLQLNTYLLEQGWARHIPSATPTVYSENLKTAEQEAMRERKGIWETMR